MSTIQGIAWKFVSFASRAAIFLVFAVGVMMLLFWFAGSFAPKVSVKAERPPANEHTGPVTVAQVRMIRVLMMETAVGTVRPVHETSVGARLHGRVVEVNLKAACRVIIGLRASPRQVGDGIEVVSRCVDCCGRVG